MISEGAKSLYSMEKLSLHGYGFDVLKQIPALLRMRRSLGDHFIANPPQIFIGIDAPDFNFSLEKRLKKRALRPFIMSVRQYGPGEKGGWVKSSARSIICLPCFRSSQHFMKLMV